MNAALQAEQMKSWGMKRNLSAYVKKRDPSIPALRENHSAKKPDPLSWFGHELIVLDGGNYVPGAEC